MDALFDELAARHGLQDQVAVCLTDPERYPHSRDMTYRYAFGRWWGAADVATTDVWVLLGPATGDAEQRKRPALERCIARSRGAGRTGLMFVSSHLRGLLPA